MDNSNSSGENWNSPVTDWSNDEAPSALNDYVVGMSGPTTSYIVRTPNAANPVFAGNSLTLSGGALYLVNQAGVQSKTVTVNDLRITNGGVIVNAFSNSTETGATQYLAGNIQFSNGTAAYNVIRTGGGNSATYNSSTGPRHIVISSNISGNGTVRVLQNGTVTLSGAANTFSGTWVVGGTDVTVNGGTNGAATVVSNNAPVDVGGTLTYLNTVLAATSVGALGLNSSVTLDLYSTLKLDYDWATTGSLTLVSNGGTYLSAVTMELDQNISVGAFSIAGTTFAAGTYYYADFVNAGFANYIAPGSNLLGSLTVVPEPGTVALLVISLGFVVLLRRRTRKSLSAC